MRNEAADGRRGRCRLTRPPEEVAQVLMQTPPRKDWQYLKDTKQQPQQS